MKKMKLQNLVLSVFSYLSFKVMMFKIQILATCRANLAEIPNNQGLVVIDEEIQPCLDMMISNRKNVQMEG